ncbi:MAG: tetraacyldisaccharide 4'-kinase [Candidatus Hydrogenedentota bacterium]
MKYSARLAGRVRRGEHLPVLVAAALRAVTPVQRIGMTLRRMRPKVRVDAYVVSVGNITAGGTGKTPAVIARVNAAMAAGRTVAVLTRAYGSQHTDEPLVLGPDNVASAPRAHFGDEAVHIARAAEGVWVVKDRNRVRGAHHAIDKLGCDYLILDDGFQYVRLARDENVLLVDATNPFGNGYLLPRGVLREPRQAVRRATEIVLTRCDLAENPREVAAALRRLNPTAPLRFTRHAPKSVRRLADGEVFDRTVLQGRTVDAACAIASPEHFFATLGQLGATVAERYIYRDHTAFDIPAAHGERWLIVTEKDAARMHTAPPHVYALGIELEDFVPV